MSIKMLEQLGLTADQAAVYSCLIHKGTLSARRITLETGIHRSLVYKIAKQLISLRLVEEHTGTGKITKFSAQPPNNLQGLVQKRVDEAQLAKSAFQEALSTLGSQFNLTCGKPTVRFYEGIEGVSMLNQDIIRTKSDIKLIRSPLDNDSPELEAVSLQQIKDQVKSGIRARVITPMQRELDDFLIKRDRDNFVTRCRVPREEFDTPAQIILYGNKVAFTSFKNCMITSIIEDASIKETMDIIFEKIWEKYK